MYVSRPCVRIISTLIDFRKIQVRAARSMEHTRKISSKVSSFPLQYDYIRVEGKTNKRREVRKNLAKPKEYFNGRVALIIGNLRVATR